MIVRHGNLLHLLHNSAVRLPSCRFDLSDDWLDSKSVLGSPGVGTELLDDVKRRLECQQHRARIHALALKIHLLGSLQRIVERIKTTSRESTLVYSRSN